MNATKIIAVILIVCGALGLAYKGFTYTKETHNADIGPLHMEVNEKEHVSIPAWAGAAALVAGIVILVMPGRRA